MLRPADDSGKSVVQRVSAAGYYAGSSILVQFMNKALFTTFHFQFPITVALAQMLVMLPICYLVAKPRLEWATAKAVFPLAVVNILNVVFGLVGTADLNVPMFIALRRFTLVCTIVLERSLMHKQHDRATIGAVALMIGGAVVAAATDLTFSLYGYVAVVINNFLTALYLIMVKNSPATSGLTTTGLLGYNAALSLPLLTAALALSNEPRQISLYPGFRWRGYQVSMVLSCILGLTVSHSTFVCTRINDPIMTSTAGNLKNVIMTVVGAFAFGDFRFSVWNSVGLGMSMVGAIWYAAKSAMKARRRMMKESMLPTRDPEKGPLIGRDRSAALRRNDMPITSIQNSVDNTVQLELPVIKPAGSL
ncbi:hypothetical protein WJX79_002261 [Trebouxia sp. C0005]